VEGTLSPGSDRAELDEHRIIDVFDGRQYR
jgi:hypothetical protein